MILIDILLVTSKGASGDNLFMTTNLPSVVDAIYLEWHHGFNVRSRLELAAACSNPPSCRIMSYEGWETLNMWSACPVQIHRVWFLPNYAWAFRSNLCQVYLLLSKCICTITNRNPCSWSKWPIPVSSEVWLVQDTVTFALWIKRGDGTGSGIVLYTGGYDYPSKDRGHENSSCDLALLCGYKFMIIISQ